jgi:hypothetical protein
MAKVQLEHYLRHFWGGASPNGVRYEKVDRTHLVDESGYEVKVDRHTVTYRDTSRTVRFGAEFLGGGELVVYSSDTASVDVVQRVRSALNRLEFNYQYK